MTTPRDPEALLSAYLEGGMEVLPDRVVDAVLDEVRRTQQRTVIGPRRTRPVYRILGVAAVVGALVITGSLYVLQRTRQDIAGPSPSPSADASPTPGRPSEGPTASPVTLPGGVWIATGTMGTPRYAPPALRLLDGKVLVLGDSSGDSDGTSAELYDPVSGTWSATGNMIRPIGFPPILLRDGRVLAGDVVDGGRPGAELYDPSTGTWSATGRMVRVADFVGDTATSRRDGQVLMIGVAAGVPHGSCQPEEPCQGGGAEVYDPDSGTWTATGKMITPRSYATATLLPDGRVLVAGGFAFPDVVTDGAELYDPSTGSWTAISDMPERLGHHTATLLRDGTVLVAGWSREQFEMSVYDPATRTWTALPARAGVNYETATLLSDGRVLMANDAFDPAAAELYEPSTRSWTTVAPLLRSQGGSVVPLLDGTILVAGGGACSDQVCVPTGSAELYVPAGVVPPALLAFPGP
jgi:hypothetical protein